MAEIVNLRLARKAKARAEKEARADENRRQHGLSKKEKSAAKRVQDEAAKHVDGHRLDDKTDD